MTQSLVANSQSLLWACCDYFYSTKHIVSLSRSQMRPIWGGDINIHVFLFWLRCQHSASNHSSPQMLLWTTSVVYLEQPGHDFQIQALFSSFFFFWRILRCFKQHRQCSSAVFCSRWALIKLQLHQYYTSFQLSVMMIYGKKRGRYANGIKIQ